MSSDDVLFDLIRRVSCLENNLSKVIMDGVVHGVQASPYRVKVNYGTADEEQLSAWLPVSVERSASASVWWPLEVGEAVTILSKNGNLDRGRVMRTRYTVDNPAPSDNLDLAQMAFGDGGFVEYDRATHKLRIILPEQATTELVSKAGIKFIGDLDVDGSINASGDITDHTRSMQNDRHISNAHDHDVVNHSKATPTPDW